MERQEGYYWVKYRGVYTVCYFGGRTWSCHWDEDAINDIDFEFINEKRIKAPGELPD